MSQQSDYSCQENGQSLKSSSVSAPAGRARAAQDPIEQAYREQEQAFERLLERYLEIYRIADKRAQAHT